MTERAYAGQTWKDGLFTGPVALAVLQILAHDMQADARLNGITDVQAIELWADDVHKMKGFFVGDTSTLADEGWVMLAVL